MDWLTIAQLIIKEGLPLAEKLVELWEKGDAPASADFVALRAASDQSASDRMTAALTKAGIALDSPQGIALLAATK